MDLTTRVALLGGAGVVAAVGVLALTVSPFRYGPVESGLLAGAFVAFAVWETVLDDASF